MSAAATASRSLALCVFAPEWCCLNPTLNKLGAAATGVRRQWVTTLLARKTLPKGGREVRGRLPGPRQLHASGLADEDGAAFGVAERALEGLPPKVELAEAFERHCHVN